MANILQQLRERLDQAAGVLEDIDEAELLKSGKEFLKSFEEALNRHAKRTEEKEQPE